MTKKISKFLLTIFLVVLLVFSCSTCFADPAEEDVNTELTTTSENTSEEGTQNNQEIHNGDLYLFDDNIVMDKLVDGNVFVFGNNVEITGQVNGNLFVFANKLTFNNCYIRYSVFACASSVYYNGACNDLYVATNKLEMTYDSYVVRDVKAVASSTIFKAAIGRDIDLQTNTLDFGSGEDIPAIYGNLRYSAKEEKVLPEESVQGEIIYSGNSSTSKNTLSTVLSILIAFITCIVTTLITYLIIKFVLPRFKENIEEHQFSIVNVFKDLGIGILTFIAVLVVCIILMIIVVGTKLAFILALLFAVICLISVPILAIAITNVLKPVLKLEKTCMFYLILALISIILYGLTLIPFIGFILSLVIKFIAIGMLIDMLLPKKQLSEEKTLAIQEAKEQAKLKREARRQEKLKAKEAKKNEQENNDE